MTDEERDTADSLDTIRSQTEELIRGARLLLKASHASQSSHAELATAWGTLASAKATLYLAEVIRTQTGVQPKELQQLDTDSQNEQVCVLRGGVPGERVELLLWEPGVRCLPEHVQPEAPR